MDQDQPAKGLVVHRADAPAWEQHPHTAGLQQKVLLSHAHDGADATVYLYQAVPDGQIILDVPKHVHDDIDDISYILAGSAVIDCDGQSPVQVGPGDFVRVPAGMRHAVCDMTADFRALNIFAPPRQ